MADQPAAAPAPELSVEQRLANYFGAQEAQPEAETPAAAQESGPQPGEATGPTPAETSAADGEDQPQDQPADAAQFDEVDWEDGNRYQIPKAIVPALMRDRDYRQKTMELAELRKATDADRFVSNANSAFQQQMAPLLTQRASLLDIKERARNIDWTALTTDQKIDADRELRRIDEQVAQIDAQLGNAYQAHQTQVSQAVLHAVGSTERFMAQKVPGWNENTGKQLHDYGLSLGIPKNKLITGWFADPVATATMWKAAQWDALQAGKPQVQNRASKAPPVIKPGSSTAQQSQATQQYRDSRAKLRKTGSLEDFAAAYIQRMK